jgi:hypothetical protein
MLLHSRDSTDPAVSSESLLPVENIHLAVDGNQSSEKY